MDICDDIRSGQRKHVIVTFQLSSQIHKTVSPEICLRETIGLYLRPHRTVEDEDPLSDDIVKPFQNLLSLY